MSTANNDNTASSPSDEDLFNEPPQPEDCPICFLRLPTLYTGRRYKTCCGKVICSGCIHAPVYDNNGNKVEKKCPFCRAPAPIQQNEKKAIRYWELTAIGGSINARHNLGNAEFRAGNFGRAVKHYMIAVELGNNECLKMIKHLYMHGGVTKDDYMNALKAYQTYYD